MIKYPKSLKALFNAANPVILVIVIFVLLAIAGIGIAKFTSMTHNPQEARVAEFNISADNGSFKDDDKTLDCFVENDTIEYTFNFSSSSEVATVTGIQIPNLPPGIDAELYIDGSPCTKEVIPVGDPVTANKYIFSTANVFEPGQKTSIAKFVFKLTNTKDIDSDIEYGGIIIDVLFDQID